MNHESNFPISEEVVSSWRVPEERVVRDVIVVSAILAAKDRFSCELFKY